MLASLLCAVRSYRPAEYAVGLAAFDLEAALALPLREPEFYAVALRAYREGIDQNTTCVLAKMVWVKCSLNLLLGGLAANIGSIAFIIPFVGWGG